MELKNFVVHKFGGASLANAPCFKEISSWLPFEINRQAHKIPAAVVVSAMSGITDQLIECYELAKQKNSNYQDKLAHIIHKHLETVDTLITNIPLKQNLVEGLNNDFKFLNDLLKDPLFSSSSSSSSWDMIAGYGELWSAQILTHLFQQEGYLAQFLDARKVLFVKDSETGPVVNWDRSQAALNEWNQKFKQDSLSKKECNEPLFLIITGFIASYLDGTPTTLKRNGSDYSAAIFAVLLQAHEITIWKDVDGILSADPKKFQKPCCWMN